MKVKELIEQLSKYDVEDDVIIKTARKNREKSINYIRNCSANGTRSVLVCVGNA